MAKVMLKIAHNMIGRKDVLDIWESDLKSYGQRDLERMMGKYVGVWDLGIQDIEKDLE